MYVWMMTPNQDPIADTSDYVPGQFDVSKLIY